VLEVSGSRDCALHVQVFDAIQVICASSGTGCMGDRLLRAWLWPFCMLQRITTFPPPRDRQISISYFLLIAYYNSVSCPISSFPSGKNKFLSFEPDISIEIAMV